ncbi:MAG: glycosyltransferase [Chloroflexi bacterium]|nr:glycosyltransferase [Chloroflexota bacterium]
MLAEPSSLANMYGDPAFLNHYEHLVSGLAGQAVAVVEDPGFASLLSINKRYGVYTILCPQNLEAFDRVLPLRLERRILRHISLAFAEEMGVLSQADCCLFISRVEAGLAGGLGMPAHYYPYHPVGDIRRILDQVRVARAETNPEPGLFLMLGSAGHSTTRESFSWFVRCVQQYGLPRGSRVLVAGSGTDRLLPAGVAVEGMEFRGWVQQEELDQRLSTVQAVLVPQIMGFGALTRLPELSYCGIPVIVSRHPTYALDLPPGVEVVEDDWDSWSKAMHHLSKGSASTPHAAYLAWEKKQKNPLEEVLRRASGIDEMDLRARC